MKKKMITSALIIFVLLPTALLLIGQLGLLAGRTPDDLGLHDGHFRPPRPEAQNEVSSDIPQQNRTALLYIAPLTFNGDGKSAFQKLTAIVSGMDGVTVVTAAPDYLRAQFRTRWLHFVDDAEFSLGPETGQIQMRSASRIGIKDLGVNRARLEAIRQQFNR